jgi:hypothetical protein
MHSMCRAELVVMLLLERFNGVSSTLHWVGTAPCIGGASTATLLYALGP